MLYSGLFVAAFLSATILPGGSEVVLVAAIKQHEASLFWLWLVATVGNTLGSVLNWLLGRFFLRWKDHRWFPASSSQLQKAEARFNRWGVWALLLAWVPLIGDALTMVAGVLRVPLPLLVLMVGIGKGARYLVVIAASVGLFSL